LSGRSLFNGSFDDLYPTLPLGTCIFFFSTATYSFSFSFRFLFGRVSSNSQRLPDPPFKVNSPRQSSAFFPAFPCVERNCLSSFPRFNGVGRKYHQFYQIPKLLLCFPQFFLFHLTPCKPFTSLHLMHGRRPIHFLSPGCERIFAAFLFYDVSDFFGFFNSIVSA